MKSNIKILSDDLINKIAAGEVIEAPSSVVKELVDNSIDAGAKTITVFVSGGGLQRISIEDDGEGMNLEDMHLAICRHATSKISQFSDLHNVMTMGFRGEALPSIASIAKMTIESAKNGTAYRLHIEGGKIIKEEKIARAKGTKVEVRSLFYNVPVRKKFQKAPTALMSSIHRLMIKMALAHTDVAFCLKTPEKEYLNAPSMDLGKKIEEIFGKKMYSSLSAINFSGGDMRLWGYIGSPDIAKKNRLGQHLFINQRPIFSSYIAQLVKEGFGTRIEEAKHPVFILHLELPPQYVDINVHPQKNQVRFCEYGKIRDLIIQALAGLWQKNAAYNFSFDHPKAPFYSDKKYHYSQTASYSFSSPKKSCQQNFIYEQDVSWIKPFMVLGHYLLLETQSLFPQEKGFSIIDLQRAECALLFHKEHKEKTRAVQKLLEPIIVEISAEDLLMYEKKQKILHQMGWESRIISNNALAVDAVPVHLEKEQVVLFIHEIMHELGSAQQHIATRKMASQLSHLVAMRKHPYSMEEGEELVRRLQKIGLPLLDPLGRAIIKKMDQEELNKLMGS